MSLKNLYELDFDLKLHLLCQSISNGINGIISAAFNYLDLYRERESSTQVYTNTKVLYYKFPFFALGTKTKQLTTRSWCEIFSLKLINLLFRSKMSD